jgi:hypothetical protein
VFEFLSPLTFLLVSNSLFSIGLVFNQNESSKDAINTQASSSSSNPLETITWICLFFQLVLLLLKIKITEI